MQCFHHTLRGVYGAILGHTTALELLVVLVLDRSREPTLAQPASFAPCFVSDAVTMLAADTVAVYMQQGVFLRTMIFQIKFVSISLLITPVCQDDVP